MINLHSSRIAEIRASRVELAKKFPTAGLYVVTAIHNYDAANRGHAWMEVSHDPCGALLAQEWQGGPYAAFAYPVTSVEEGQAFIEHLRERERAAWQAEMADAPASLPGLGALSCILLLLLLTGCHAPPATTEAAAVREEVRELPLEQLFAEAKEALAAHLGPASASRLNKMRLEVVPHAKLTLAASIAERRGNMVYVSEDHSAAERELFDTLVHELMHGVTDMQQPDFETESPLSIRVRLAVNEAISYRVAAELTAARYGGSPQYTWELLPARTGLPASLIVFLVCESSLDVSMAIASDAAAAASFLRGIPPHVPRDESPLSPIRTIRSAD